MARRPHDEWVELAGGGDDGVSLLTVIPGGRLVHLGSVADSTDTTLGAERPALAEWRERGW